MTAATGRSVAGGDVVEHLVTAGLVKVDDDGALKPQLAMAAPTLENGLWKLAPDGRMEMTWKLNPAALWHDGVPVTSDDVVFTALVAQDKDIPAVGNIAYASVDQIRAPDATTVLVTWKRPYIRADRVFSDFSLPWPKHLLERSYLEDKATFTQLPFWRTDFVSSGPFKLDHWEAGSGVTLTAFDGYALGRPKIDAIDVHFILDGNALAANILAGAIEVTLGRGTDPDQAVDIRDQWRQGRMDVKMRANWIVINPQLLTPDPPVVGDPRFRRALMHALDRQEMAESLMHGLAPVSDSWVTPSEPEYPDVESSIVRYGFDPRQAAQILEGMSYAKGPDGILRDARGDKLAVEIRTTTTNENQPKSMLAAVGYWAKVGVVADPVVVPQQRSRDSEYRATFPGLELQQNPNDANSLGRLHSSETPLPENSFAGSNKNRYINPEFDQQIERFFATVPRAERMGVLRSIVHRMTDQVLQMGMFLVAEPMLIGDRLQNVGPGKALDSDAAWNAELWEVA